MNSSH